MKLVLPNLFSVLLIVFVSDVPTISARAPLSQIGQRIIGGSEARVGELPFSAAIIIEATDGIYFCGGALLNRQWIITGALCAEGATRFTIILGTNDLLADDPNALTVATEEYHLHPLFNPANLNHDIALIKFRLPIEYTTHIQPISLPVERLTDYAVVVATGWGQTSDNDTSLPTILRRVTIAAFSNEECRLTYGNAIIDEMLCAEGNLNQGTCYGDSGSPLVQYGLGTQGVVVAISSFFSSNGCDGTDPSGFTRVFPYLSWIQNVTTAEE